MPPQIRESDRVPLDDSTTVKVRFSRVIPTWQVIAALCAFIIGGVSQGIIIWYGLQDQVKETRLVKEAQTEMKAEIREIRKDLNVSTVRGIEIGYELANLKQRVSGLETRVETMRR